MEEEATAVWIKTLRERTHRLQSTTAALEMSVQMVVRKQDELANQVQRMATADEIARGVADELRRRESSHRDKIDSGLKRMVWSFGVILTVLQIVSILAFK